MAKDDSDGSTIDLFGSFDVPAKKTVEFIASKEDAEKIKSGKHQIHSVGFDIMDTIDTSKPEPTIKLALDAVQRMDDAFDNLENTIEKNTPKPEIPKRDLTMDDLGWQREFIPHLNDFAYLSNSRIKKILESMAHFEWSYVRKIRSEETDAQRLGKIVHHAILEPELFKTNHIIIPKFTGTGSKAAKAEFLGGLPQEAIIMTEKEVDKVLYMIDSVLNHPTASTILKGADFELNGYVWDERHEIFWLIKPDILKTTLVSDLKTSKSANPHDFSRDIFNYGYYLQTAIYLDKASILLGKKLTHFPFVVIENVAPHICEVYKVSDALVEQGRQLVDMAIISYKHHMSEWQKAKEKGQRYFWPGYTGSGAVSEINIPTWAQYRLEALELAHIG